LYEYDVTSSLLRVSVGLLLGEEDNENAVADAPIRDLSLLERVRDLEKLDRKDREVAITLLDPLVESRHHHQANSRRRRIV
jgi:hypothetical protein